MCENQEWLLCEEEPLIGDTLKWNEPLWAAPNKPRGKRDKIGEQEIIAELMADVDVLELEVLSVKKISSCESPLKVKAGDYIRRKKTTLEQGLCHKLLS